MSITRHHNEWLSLVPNSGPFLSLPVLAQTFPQGLDAHDVDHTRRLRLAFNEWDDNQLGRRPEAGIHREWIKLVLGETLGYDELLAEGQAIPQTLKSEISEYGETLRPDWIVNDPATKKARLLVQVYPRSQSLTKPVQSSRWKSSPDTRMMQLLHDTGIRLGIITNGDHWMLVNAPKNETTGYASWYANLWLEELITLRAFRTMLCADRFFSVPENETLEALLDKSANDQQEVTDQLGYQVRKAVEVLIQALDKADQDYGRKLLADVEEKVLYESALTVMMRLVFLFCAEERELLLLGDDLYDENYAVSTLREQLRIKADLGEELLEVSGHIDAWMRLLTTFRVVYAGARHDRLSLPAYGGSLFNPDRFPFLEGRGPGTSWKDTGANPLPVSNLTVLRLLEALQVLRVRLPGGGAAEARKLSFRSLDIEQIGHVYEGLLDHTAKRATEPMLGLAGTRDKEPEISLADLEKIAAKGEKELLKFLKDETGRSESALKKGLNAEIEDQLASRFRTACQDSALWKRVQKFAGLVRLDTSDYPVVITSGSVFVAAGTDRRSSGTHYTPKSLTEPIVRYTLEPLVFLGPAEGLPKDQWSLRPAKELLALRICDMACGSGAFLVQACRYMAARLLEAWDAIQKAHPGTVRITPEGEPSTGKPGEMLIPDDPDERLTYALRIVAQRCLYGVDKNPLAAEMAKLSLWLLTLAKDKPFEFLDHAIRCGDSLVGIHNMDQLRKFNLDGTGEDNSLFLQFLDPKIKEAIALRRQITELQANTVEQVEAQERMLQKANEKIDRLKCAADMLVGAEFLRWDQIELVQQELEEEERDNDDDENWQPSWVKAKKETAQFRNVARTKAAIEVSVRFYDSDLDTFQGECAMWLNGQTPFHWPLEFPEVMVERGGFDGIVGNPPFVGGQLITLRAGPAYREFLVQWIAKGKSGSADLCSYFLLRSCFLFRSTGMAGLIATNTISEGETRSVGLGQLASFEGKLRSAVSVMSWPGDTALSVSILWLCKQIWNGKYLLDGLEVDGIDSTLTPAGGEAKHPNRLLQNKRIAYKGTSIQGIGFLVTPEQASEILKQTTEYEDVLFPFLSGADITGEWDGKATRWAINFFDWTLDKAERYPICLQIVREKVKPEREKAGARNAIGRKRAQYWWRYDARAADLYEAISHKGHVWAAAETSKYFCVIKTPTNILFAHKVVVFCDNSFCFFGLLNSAFHLAWIETYASSLDTRIEYTIADGFETFPIPNAIISRWMNSEGRRIEMPRLETASEAYFQCREKLTTSGREGLTKTYNRFHDPDEGSTDIQKLRELQIEMDNAVTAAYGWTDIDLGHGFQETKQGVRYTISEPARREVLARLLKLNHERYAEEVAKGLHDKKKGKAAKGRKNAKTTETSPELFSGSS